MKGNIIKYCVPLFFDIAQASGIGITQPRGLHRSRYHSKHGQAIALGVACQINEHIDTIVFFYPNPK